MDIRLDTRYSKSFRTLVGISEDRYCLLSRRRKESWIFPLICMRRCAQLWKLIRHRASIKFRMDRPRICFVQSRLSFEQEYNRGGFEIVGNWTRLVSTRSKLSSMFEKTFGWTARRVVPEEQRRVKRGEWIPAARVTSRRVFKRNVEPRRRPSSLVASAQVALFKSIGALQAT